MDISLCAIKENELLFAGANNPMWLVRNKELKEFSADKQPIGFHPNLKPFSLSKFSLEQGDSIYLFSDGYADQFGGPKRKKFMYRQFEELLISIHKQEMSEQKKILDEKIEAWKGKLEQIDDILVMGIRF